MEKLAHPLRRMRDEYSLTQDELAALLGYATTAKICSLEHGSRVSEGKVELLCDLFGIDRDQFRAEERAWQEQLRERVRTTKS